MTRQTSPADLASLRQQLLARMLTHPQASLQAPVRPYDRPPLLPASRAQRRLWFLDQLLGESAAYNEAFALRLRGELDVDALEASLHDLCERHESMRTTFSSHDDQLLQHIAPHPQVPLVRTDLLGSEAAASELPLANALATSARLPFRLVGGPLVRFELFTVSEQEHVLVLTMHHAVTDGWSERILFRELEILYAAHLRQCPVELSPVGFQYADYTLWDNERFANGGYDTALSYWAAQLADEVAVLEWPQGRQRSTASTAAGDQVRVDLPQALVAGARSLAAASEASLYMVMLAAFAVLVHRNTGAEDLVIGVPVANRTRPEWEDTVGLFTNVLPVRLTINEQSSLRDVLIQVRERMHEGLSHQDVPFDELVARLSENGRRGGSHFQVVCNMVEATAAPVLPGLDTNVGVVGTATSKFDLELTVTQDSERVVGVLDFSTEVLDVETVERMAGHFRNALAGLVADVDQSVGDVKLLSPHEQESVLSQFEAEPFDRSRNRLTHEYFEEQADRAPDAVALCCAGVVLTYARLDEAANQVAHFLRERGVQMDGMVGIALQPGIDSVVWQLGALKAGAGFVPLDTAYPSLRLASMIGQCRPAVVVATGQTATTLPKNAPVVLLEEVRDEVDRRPARRPDRVGDPAGAAYVVFTSGSTGKPKGVAVSHDALCNTLEGLQRDYRLGCDDVVLASTAPSFDPSVWQVMLPLMTGARLVMPDTADTHRDPAVMVALIRREEVTFVYWVPSVLDLVLDEPDIVGCTSLRYVHAGGEALTVRLCRRFAERNLAVLANGYGPAETAIEAVRWLSKSPGDVETFVPIGLPNANVTCYVLDAAMTPVPLGTKGELFIGGEGVGRGYVGAPQQTAERFLPDPFTDVPGRRLYRTGDRVRSREGMLEFLGRVDRQVKLHGQRVETQEVERVLEGCPGVAQAVVSFANDTGGGHLLAHFVAAADVDENRLRDQLARSLPEYMVPTRWMRMHRMPIGPNGKVDHAALPPPPDPVVVKGDEPATPTEVELAQVWQRVLGRAPSGRSEHFFRSGGHSLQALRVLAEIRRRWRIDIPLRLMFDEPVLCDLASRIECEVAGGGAGATDEIPAGRRGEPTPLSPFQEHLWFIDQFDPDSPVYNTAVAVELGGSLDLPALQRSLDGLLRRHDVLRSVVDSGRDRPFQVVGQCSTMQLEMVGLDEVPAEQRSEQARTIAQAFAERRFDLKAGPLVRAQLTRLSSDRHILAIALHHLIFDDRSRTVLLRDLSELYRAERTGQPAELPSLSVQFGDYARWQQVRLAAGSAREHVDYWRTQLHGAPRLLDMPTDRPRPAVRKYAGATKSVVLPGSLRLALKELGDREAATLHMVLLAAWNVLLSRCTGQEDVCVGTTVSARDRASLDDLIGFFVNTLVVRTDLSGDPGFTDLLRRVRQTVLDAHEHRNVPFARLVEELRPDRSLSHSPLFQTLFDMNHLEPVPTTLHDVDVHTVPVELSGARFDLTLSVFDADAELVVELEHDTDLFTGDTARRLLHMLSHLLEAVTASPTAPIGELELHGEDERAELVRGLNQTARPVDVGTLVHEAFERSAKAAPDAIALVHGEQQLTYARLDADANRLAHRLLALKVGPEVCVGLCMERGVDMFVSLLAILKAGGAYVPLDATYPADRLDFMVREARLVGVLTHRCTQEQATGTAARTGTWVLPVDRAAADLAQLPAHRPQVGVNAQNLVHVLYTSGSTGVPKGVSLTHQALCNLMSWDAQEIPVRPGGSVLQFNSLGFDRSFLEAMGAWQTGARLVVLPYDHDRRDPGVILNLLEREQIERFDAPFAGLVGVARWALQESRPRSLSLRTLMSGGEQVKITDDLVAWTRELTDCAVYNQYGPSEVNTATSYRFSGPPPAWPILPPIGWPADNTRVYILDRNGTAVPVGVPGEIYIAGLSLARGYANRPDLTADRFLPDPFSLEPGGRMYRTGDLGRYRTDSAIEYLDRIDTQLKLRGHRVELGEIETVLHAHPLVRSCAVTVVGAAADDRYLAAYLVAVDPDAPPTGSEIRAHLAQRLPNYMVPSRMLLLPSLPLTSSGKVDRKALPTVEVDTVVGGRDSTVARTSTERELVALWREVLDLTSVGVHESFFDLGGHSLLATRMVAEGRARGLVTLSIRQVFQHPTIAGLADELGGQPGEAPGLEEPRVAKQRRRRR